MIGVVERHVLRRPESAGRGRLVLETIFANVTGNAELARAQPEMLEIDHPRRAAHRPERMDVAVALARPVLERNAELERGARGANEIDLVDAHILMESAGGRDRGLADADSPDLVRFDERDVDQRTELLHQGICGD